MTKGGGRITGLGGGAAGITGTGSLRGGEGAGPRGRAGRRGFAPPAGCVAGADAAGAGAGAAGAGAGFGAA
jgi:hypothetical protein